MIPSMVLPMFGIRLVLVDVYIGLRDAYISTGRNVDAINMFWQSNKSPESKVAKKRGHVYQAFGGSGKATMQLTVDVKLSYAMAKGPQQAYSDRERQEGLHNLLSIDTGRRDIVNRYPSRVMELGEHLVAILHTKPRNTDEMLLEPGDVVVLTEIFSNEWARGHKLEGKFWEMLPQGSETDWSIPHEVRSDRECWAPIEASSSTQDVEVKGNGTIQLIDTSIVDYPGQLFPLSCVCHCLEWVEVNIYLQEHC
jgi:hypothetical protein